MSEPVFEQVDAEPGQDTVSHPSNVPGSAVAPEISIDPTPPSGAWATPETYRPEAVRMIFDEPGVSTIPDHNSGLGPHPESVEVDFYDPNAHTVDEVSAYYAESDEEERLRLREIEEDREAPRSTLLAAMDKADEK